MRDELLDVLLGCGCRKRCCCGEPEPDFTPPGNLFQSAPRTLLPPPLPEETPFIPPVPSFDTPQRPGLWAGGLSGSGGGET